MSKSSDITRWNRAGLRRIRYVDANAATLLEELRIRLAERFPHWATVRGPSRETEVDRQARLLARYEAPRAADPDWGWEIARALARAMHVLTEHVDAYANEGFLGTATQWESLRRLVEMIDYHPRPPASAFTPLVLNAKPGAHGKVGKGLAVRHSPPDGSAPVVFETLEELDVDAGLNALRPRGHGINPEALDPGTKQFELEGSISGINVGEPIVLESEEANGLFRAYVVEQVVQGEHSTRVTVTLPLESEDFTKGRTWVHVRPRERLAPLGPLTEVAEVDGFLRLKQEPRGLLPGEIVTITDGRTRHYREVWGTAGRELALGGGSMGKLLLERATVARPVLLAVARHKGTKRLEDSVPPAVVHSVQVAGDWSRLINETLGDPRAFGTSPKVKAATVQVLAASVELVGSSGSADGGYTLLELKQLLGGDDLSTLENPRAFLLPPVSGGWELDVPLVPEDEHSRLPMSLTVTQPKGLAANDFVVVVAGSRASWGRLDSVTVDAETRSAVLQPKKGWQSRGLVEDFPVSQTRVFGQFQQKVRLVGGDENKKPLEGKEVPLEAVPVGLRFGRQLVVRQEGGKAEPLLTRVRSLREQDGSLILTLADPLPAGSTVGNLILHGNVVLAGHGERRPERVLGSGDATRTQQTFLLRERDISFVPDATRPSGVRADLDVVVEGRTWTQVSSLNESGPTDPHYMVRMSHDGEPAVVFGDGRNGRRLPTGVNNVRIFFRVGAGLVGNVAAGSLEKPGRPHPLVESVMQPMRATGGNDMEGVEMLRRSARATVLALARAVSTSDFASLATGHSSVWQARSFSRRSGDSRQQRVEVVVVPALGGKLGPLKQTLEDYLRAHSVPGVEVVVSDFESQRVKLQVTVQVDLRAFNPDTVMKDVRAALQEALSLRQRELGQPLYLSDIYKVVEAVPGVESSVCIMQETPDPQRLDATSDAHVIYLEPGGSDLTVGVEEYMP